MEIFLDAVLATAEPVKTHFLWRPQLRDPGDEMVLEAAVIGLQSLSPRTHPRVVMLLGDARALMTEQDRRLLNGHARE